MTKVFKGKVFRDPVHDLITIGENDKVILDLINTSEFQRLRRIKQLGFCSYTYHGAEHSRFSHSMGVFHSARRMVNSLKRHYKDKPEYKGILEKHAINIKIAALLHDLGHGPFSHAFEHAIKSKKHADWTIDIIKNPEGNIRKVLEGNNINSEEIEEIVNIIKERVREPFVVDVVSSQLYADKMDYLLRDSLMTGTEYGNFDYEWMLHALRIGEVEIKSEDGNSLEKVHKLCIDGSKGIHSVEEYVLARLFMYMQVYFHKTTRAYESLLINILRFASYIVQQGKVLPSGTHELINKIVRQDALKVNEYLELDDILFMSTLKNWSICDGADSDIKELAQMSKLLFLRGVPYKHVDLSDDTKMSAYALVKILDHTSNPLRFYCHYDQAQDTPYKGILYELKSKGGEEKVSKPIYTLGKDGEEPIPIETNPESILKSFESKKFEKARFFYDRDKENDFKPLMKEHKIQ